MSRCVELIASAREAFNLRTPAAIYQWVQHLDDEYSRHRYPELLIHHLSRDEQADEAFNLACVSAIQALTLSLSLRLHVHYRRVLVAACISRALHDDLSWWQQQGLTQPVWSAAFGSTTLGNDSFFVSQWCLQHARSLLSHEHQSNHLQPLLSGSWRSRYWFFAEHLHGPLSWTTGCQLVSAEQDKSGYLLTLYADHALLLLDDFNHTEKIPAQQYALWQSAQPSRPSLQVLEQLEYQRQLNQHLPAVSFKAPKALLNAVKRYTAGSGALAPVIQHIRQQPVLADSLRQAAKQQMIAANNPQRMDLKHVYLWLGGARASATLATASLQQQFMQQRVPVQQSLMQRLTLLTTVLQRLSKQCQQRLPVPASLLTLLSAADLFRNAEVLGASHWPRIKVLQSADKAAWVSSSNPPSTDTRLSHQLVKRWQLEKQLAPLLSPEQHSQHALLAMMRLANIAVALTFQPKLKLSNTAEKHLRLSLSCLDLTVSDFSKLQQQCAYRCQSFSPLTEFFNFSGE